MKHLREIIIISAVLLMIFYESCYNKNDHLSKKNSQTIEKYLDTEVLTTSYGGKILSSNKIFDKKDNKIYLWAYMQEYYIKDGKVKLGSGWSLPLILNIEENPNGIIVKSHTAPRDGELYSLDIDELFPEEIRQKIFYFPGTQEMKKLEEISKKRSEKL